MSISLFWSSSSPYWSKNVQRIAKMLLGVNKSKTFFETCMVSTCWIELIHYMNWLHESHKNVNKTCTRSMWPSVCHMTLNTSSMSPAESHEFTYPWGLTQIHTHRKLAENNCLGLKSSLVPPASLTGVRRSEQGLVCRGKQAEWLVLEEACGRDGFTERGGALLEVLDVSGKAFSAPWRAAE